MRRAWIATLGGIVAAVVPAGAARHAPASAPDPTTAVERGLALIQRGAARYITTQDCFSCHHQALPLMTAAAARRRGIAIDAAGDARQLAFTVGYFSQSAAEMRRGIGVPGANDTVGYGLAGLAGAGHPPDSSTEAMALFLYRRQLPDGSWIASADRPPFEGSDVTATALAVAGLAAYSPRERSTELAGATTRARNWLRSRKPSDTEDLVYRLRGLAAAGDRETVPAAVEALRGGQRPDGGWAQLPRLRSDAYATGQALLALHEAGSVGTDDPAYRRGIQFLLATQAPDGSWKVATRARPLQFYFDNGDPYGKSQFISFTATNLAVMAILRSLPQMAARQ